MGLLRRLADRFDRETRAQPEPSWRALETGASGATHGAENLATVLACVGAISSALASLPVYVRRRENGGRVVDEGHPVTRLIERGPNDQQSWPEFIEWLAASTLLRGNALAEVVTDARGAPVELVPIPWDHVSVQITDAGRLIYDVTDHLGRMRRLLQDEVLHLRDRTDDGRIGVSRLHRARNVIEAGQQIQAMSQSIYKHGVHPSGVVEADEAIGPEQIEQLSQRFRQAFGGTTKAGSALVLDQGLKWRQLGVSPEDAELLQSRRFSVEELARIFQVPPPIIGDLSHGTFTNTETVGRWFATNTLTPWITKLEAAIKRSVFSEASRASHDVHFDLSGFLRGDPEQRWQAHKVAIETGVLGTDEIRAIEGFNPRTREQRSLDDLTPEQRQSLQRRLAIRERYKPELVAALKPIVERDAQAVLDALEAGTVDALISSYASEYGGDEGLVASAIVGTALQMEGEVRGVLEAETGQTLDHAKPFTQALAGSVGTAYAKASEDTVTRLKDQPEALRERVKVWAEGRADELGGKVATRVESGTSHRLYRKAGRKRAKVVDPQGRNVTGGLDEPFTKEGDAIGEGIEASADLYNPPLAVGDDRVLVAD